MSLIEHEIETLREHARRTNVNGSAIVVGINQANTAWSSEVEALREELAGAVKTLRLIAEHARLDHAERGIAEAERYALLAEDTLNQLGGQ